MLYEIVDEIAQKQIVKTETGDNRIFGVVVGQVTKNYVEEMPGRVCVKILSRDDKANELLWARVAQPSSGLKWGHYFLPEVGDEVLVAFEEGNIERPYVVGCIPLVSDQFLKKAVDKKNQFKKIVSTHGNTICLQDSSEDKEGKKDRITITSSTGEHKIELDNEKDFILVSDKKGNNSLKINTQEGKGTIEIKTEKKLTIKVGDNITLTMNGSNGTVELSASKINLKSTDTIKLEATGRLDLSGANAQVKGNSMTKIESGGPVTVSGTPIKLG
ncbi:MAG: phage baseplate assembly protein V [Lachnospiraceae bacterium]|nr:phage baseplate assembly protein V [Lachnospiraceae bacterium]